MMPWDGRDGDGKPILGDAVLTYHFHVYHANGGVDNPDYRQVGPTLMGTMPWFLDDGTP